MRKLPLDTSTFSRIREDNYLYVDKTQYMYQMITGGGRYFLSRPRRFGKSLLVSTLKEILSAHKELFNGLWIHLSDYQWHEHGIIQLDFSKLRATDLEAFRKRLSKELLIIAKNYNIDVNDTSSDPDELLQDVVLALHKQFGRVAILVDEYDSPILKSLHNQSVAQEIRDEIQHFFTVIKALDAHISFVFITGVSSFAKAGLFSGINNLQILTLRKEYATICGYSDDEIDHYFADYIADWAKQENKSYDKLHEQIRTWYNGYSFGYNVPKAYNPFSVMNALNEYKFGNFWFQSGTPTFLVEMLKKEYKTFDPEDLTATEDFLGIFDINTIPLLSLMFQAGYLTITGYNEESKLFDLDYPNEEVRVAFQKYLLEVFAHIDAEVAQRLSLQLKAAFEKEDLEKVIELLQQLFAHVPYQLHIKEERYYHSLLIMACVIAGIKSSGERSTSHGRIDLVLEFSQKIYVIEVKFNDTAENALLQIEDRRYYEKFLIQNKPIILLGLSFKKEPQSFTVSYVMKKL